MAFIPYPNGVKAVLEYGSANLEWTNTLWFEELTPGIGDMQELADYLHTWTNTNILPQMSNAFSCKNVYVYDMSAETGVVVQSTVTPVIGGVVDSAGAISSAIVVTFRTGTRGKSGRGRNYLAGFAEEDMTSTAIADAAVITAVENAYDLLITEVQTSTDYYWVVASQYSGGLPRAEVLGFQVLNAEVRNATFGTQRRRIDRA